VEAWFASIVQGVLRRALLDAHPRLQDALDALGTPGTKPVLASSPDVRVVDTSPDGSTATIEITGQQPLFGRAVTPLVRIRTVISRAVSPDPENPIEIREWRAVVGDLKIQKAPTFTGALTFGWEHDHWTGRGALAIGPAGFGVDILLRALSDAGLALGIKVKLPAPIPLGPTGLALMGVGGDFAYNFEPDVRPEVGANPTALEYVRWARDRHDAWKASPIERTAVGIGLNAGLGDVASNGFLLKLAPVGLAVLIPGPVFVFGGEGAVLDTGSIKAKGYVAVDVPYGSMGLGLGATIRYPLEPFTFVEGHGTLEGFYSFSQPSQWFVHMGTLEAPIAATIRVPPLKVRGEAFLVMDRTGVHLGIEVDLAGRFDIAILAVWVHAGVSVDAMAGWDPFQLEGLFRLWGELGLSIFGIDFRLAARAEATGRAPHPTWIQFDARVELDLPWPLPDFAGHVKVPVGEDDTVPEIAKPLRSVAPSVVGEQLKLAALHALTGRQWDLEKATRGEPAAADQGFPWPDVEIMIPFNQPTRDDTHTVLNPFPGTRNQGGYDVTHAITGIEVRNLSADGHPLVSPLHGVWAGAADGTTGRFHLLGTDPFAWLAPHTDVSRSALFLQGAWREQRFGPGPQYQVGPPLRFGDVVLRHDASTYLATEFMPGVPTRIVRSESFFIDFSTADGLPLAVDKLILLVLAGPREHGGPITADIEVDGAVAPVTQLADTVPVYGDVHLALVAVPVRDEGVSSFRVRSGRRGTDVLVVGVRYHMADQVRVWTSDRTLLEPATYELTVQGESRAHYANADPAIETPPADPDPVPWTQTQRFDVVNPPSLRPYIRTTTIGDPRIFGATPRWDPTPIGVGFPVYRRYRPVVSFVVSYLHRIFDPLRARLRYHDGQVVQHDTSSAAAHGISSLPLASRIWWNAHGASPPSDEELVVPGVLPPAGPVTVSLSFPMPDGSGEIHEIQLDEWAAYVSRFERFADHLAMPEVGLTTFHGPEGTATWEPCPIPPDMAWPPNFPDEIVDVSPSWQVPAALDDLIRGGRLPRPLGPETPVVFGRFAAATGARFNATTADPLVGIGDLASATTVEAVSDGAREGPPALWLRTPEPVDWSRVTGTLRIFHVVQPGGCPSEYSFRQTLVLDVLFVPSPDASSAFFVGMFGGVLVRLPQGVYELTLRFDPNAPGRTALRPDPQVGPLPETATLQFVQPAGLPWPRPPAQLPEGSEVHEHGGGIDQPKIRKPPWPPTWPQGFDWADPQQREIVLEASARLEAGLVDATGAVDFALQGLTELAPQEPGG
jgi:hypothetical protein